MRLIVYGTMIVGTPYLLFSFVPGQVRYTLSFLASRSKDFHPDTINMIVSFQRDGMIPMTYVMCTFMSFVVIRMAIQGWRRANYNDRLSQIF